MSFVRLCGIYKIRFSKIMYIIDLNMDITTYKSILGHIYITDKFLVLSELKQNANMV